MPDLTCGTCRFMDVIVLHDEGEQPETICRRFPPSNGSWTTVLADDWCGEFCHA